MKEFSNRADVPVAYSMLDLVGKSSDMDQFQEFMCYWIAFNNIYTVISLEKDQRKFQHKADGSIETEKNGSVDIPKVKGYHKEGEAIFDYAFDDFSPDLKIYLICHPSTKFFVNRSPKWKGEKIEVDEKGQKLNGVIQLQLTIDRSNPVWSPIDIDAYNRYAVDKKPKAEDQDLLAEQVLGVVYTVRNNAFHAGKTAHEMIEGPVIRHALELLKVIVHSYIPSAASPRSR